MNNKHILWADDEIHLLKPHIIFMEDKGYKVTPVNSGEDAIIECKKSDIDLILIDEMMTGLNGIETINIIKSNNPEIPIIMVTKNEEEWLMEEAISIHIANFLTKPVNPSQILIACKTVLEQNILEKDKIITVETDKFIVLLNVKKVEATIAGTINKMEKGFVIPPVKYNNKDN